MAGDGRQQPIQPQSWLPDVPFDISEAAQNLLTEMKFRLESLYTDPTPPGPPTSLTAEGVAFGNLIRWHAPQKAAGYRVYRNISNVFATATLVQELKGLDNVSWYDSFLVGTSSTKYYWVVAVSSGGVPSPVSSMVSVVSGTSLGVGVITETNIADDSISTPKLQANAVTAVKIDVTDLFAQTITATGSITGATIATHTTGHGRIEIDPTNGIRAINSVDTTRTHITTAGNIETALINGITGGVDLYDNTGVTGITVTTSNRVDVAAGSLVRMQVSTAAITATNGAVFTGDGSGLTTLNASNLSSGTVADARLSGNVLLTSSSLNASNLSSGTVADARLSGNVPLLNAANTWTDDNFFESANFSGDISVDGDIFTAFGTLSTETADLGTGTKTYVIIA